MLKMPLISYPTKIVWADDDELLLNTAIEALSNQEIIPYHSPKECIRFFEDYQSHSASLSLFRGYKEHENYDLNNHFPTDLNLNSILQLQNNPKRSQDISIIIVDYHMPHMTGIELCRQLRGLPIKKLLLTGEANHRLATEAFNDGVIDCFIRKDELLLISELSEQITKLKADYFTDITKYLLAYLEVDYKLPHSDPIFIEYFTEWCRSNQIREYYIIDKNGTFLTIDEENVIRYFVAHTDRTLNLFTQLYYGEDKRAELFVQSVMERTKIPFFGIHNESWNFEFNDWSNFFHTPNIIKGREMYYWISVDNSSSLNKKCLHAA